MGKVATEMGTLIKIGADRRSHGTSRPPGIGQFDPVVEEVLNEAAKKRKTGDREGLDYLDRKMEKFTKNETIIFKIQGGKNLISLTF